MTEAQTRGWKSKALKKKVAETKSGIRSKKTSRESQIEG